VSINIGKIPQYQISWKFIKFSNTCCNVVGSIFSPKGMQSTQTLQDVFKVIRL
jgi:hypothetical protein